jgi:hypothetical protein
MEKVKTRRTYKNKYNLETAREIDFTPTPEILSRYVRIENECLCGTQVEGVVKYVKKIPTYEARDLPYRSIMFHDLKNILADHYQSYWKEVFPEVYEWFHGGNYPLLYAGGVVIKGKFKEGESA